MKDYIKIPINDLSADARCALLCIADSLKRLSRKKKRQSEEVFQKATGEAVLSAVNDFYKLVGEIFEETGLHGVIEALGGNDGVLSE